jgi:hypothetical protein
MVKQALPSHDYISIKAFLNEVKSLKDINLKGY